MSLRVQKIFYPKYRKSWPKRVQKLLLEGKQSAFISRELVKLKDDIFDNLELKDFIFEDKNYLIALEDEFKSIV